MSWPHVAHLPAAHKAKISAALKRAYVEGRHTRHPDHTPEGRARRIAAAVAYNRVKVECPLCHKWIGQRQMGRHQRGRNCR